VEPAGDLRRPPLLQLQFAREKVDDTGEPLATARPALSTLGWTLAMRFLVDAKSVKFRLMFFLSAMLEASSYLGRLRQRLPAVWLTRSGRRLGRPRPADGAYAAHQS